MKKLVIMVVCLLVMFSFVGCASGVPQADYDAVVVERDTLQASSSVTQSDLDTAIADLKTKTEEVATLSTENETLNALVAEQEAKLADAAPWFQKSEEEKQALVAEQEAAVEAERVAAEEKEKLGYDTGITYDQLSRSPDEYKGEKIKFKGKVLQVSEDGNLIGIRLATSGSYKDVIYCILDSAVVSQRILDDDKITVYGTSGGIFKYQSTGSGEISIPSVLVEKIDV